MMNGKDYLMTQMTLIQLGAKAYELNLEGFLDAIEKAETKGALIDPTLFNRAIKNLQAIKKLAKAFQGVQDAFEETRESVINSTVAFMTKEEGKKNEQETGNP